ncbi:MAG: universal stress protein [Anaerolineae bacterium]|nr:universal stress protein [Anaerolineae bacterium]
MMFKRILFATDFSPHAEVAKQVAIQLARGDSKRLWALTVLEPVEEPLTAAMEPPEVPAEEWEALVTEERQELGRERADRLAQDVAEIESAGVSVTKLIREGDPDREIIAAAKEVEADLIVMGSHSQRNIWDVVLGSTAAKVAKSAPCPVLIVSHRPPHPNVGSQRILFAADFSPYAEVAQKVAVSLAKERGRQLWVLTVIDSGGWLPLALSFEAADQAALSVNEKAREEVEAAVDHRLDAIAAEVRAQGIQVEKLIRHGHPAKEIRKAAVDIDADMIVLGSHGRRSIWDVLMGNTAANVAQHASCPVLIVSHRLTKNGS